MRSAIIGSLIAYSCSVLAQSTLDVPTIPAATLGYTGPMEGKIDGDNDMPGDLCMLPPRPDKVCL